jgi:hypothetical protein
MTAQFDYSSRYEQPLIVYPLFFTSLLHVALCMFLMNSRNSLRIGSKENICICLCVLFCAVYVGVAKRVPTISQ